MKKIIAILLALALVSMAFAQTVSVTNTLSTNPTISIEGWSGTHYWMFDNVLDEKVEGYASTADGRATFGGATLVRLQWLEKEANSQILSFSPRWKFSKNYSYIWFTLKPIEHLELHVNAGDSVAGPGIKWVDCKWLTAFTQPSITSNGMTGLISADYSLLDDNLKILAGLGRGFNNVDYPTWIKKGAYGPFELGINFKITDDVSVGAKWCGQFGGYNENAPNNQGKGDTDKSFQKHGVYVGADLNMFQDAKIGTKLGVGFSYDMEKASTVMGTKKNNMLAATVKADFDFRNSISDSLWVSVGWRNYDGKKTKILPFAIGNTLTYQVSEDAKFTFDTQYAQGSTLTAKKNYDKGEIIGSKDDAAVLTSLNGHTIYASVIHVKPNFEFKLGGKHTFAFGVETDVFNQMKHWNKTDRDWAYTTIQGIYAKVAIPVSWSYTFN